MNAPLTHWNPYREFNDIQNRLSSLITRRPGDSGEWLEPAATADWAPAVDITEDEKEYLVSADLPEVKKDEVKVTVENGTLTITGERKKEEESDEEKDKKKYHRIERSYGKYMRSFRLPEEVEASKVDATFKDGVLTVHLPKAKEKQPSAHTIKIH